MKTSACLYENAKDIWEGYLQQPFVKELGEGTLSLERFQYYMLQDYLYLLDYVKVFAYGVVKAKDEGMMAEFTSMLHHTLHGEMDIHRAYMSRVGISEEAVAAANPVLANRSYTSYMLDVAARGDELDVLVAVLSCAWTYAVIGKHHMGMLGAQEHIHYGEWVRGYCSDEFQNDSLRLIGLVDELGADISDKRRDELCDVFRNCCLFERGFWDMAYRMDAE